MSDLMETFRARLDRDEQVAIGVSPANGPGPSLWVLDDDYKHDTLVIDSARVLADIAAKRRLLELRVGDESLTGRRIGDEYRLGILDAIRLLSLTDGRRVADS